MWRVCDLDGRHLTFSDHDYVVADDVLYTSRRVVSEYIKVGAVR
jgi:hypothetical protein